MRLVFASATLLAVVLASETAHAIEFGTPASYHPYRSPQNFALELRFSPYLPSVDDEPGLAGRPFERAFGDSPRLSFQLEFDWQFFRIPHVGTIGPGLGAGVATFSRDVRTVSGRESGDETSLTIYPFWAAAVLRGDVFWRELKVPIVPYGKLGLGMGLWRASGSAGTSKDDAGVAGKGMSFGSHAAIGAALALDFIDYGASRSMDDAIGINNTYLFGEYYWLALGAGDALRVGTNTWAAGLAFEF